MQLKDIVEYVVDNRGKSAPVSDKGEYPLIEINAIGGFHPDYSAIRKYVSGDVYKCWFRAGHPKKNDILLPTVGTIGIASLMDETEGCIAQNLIALRIKPSVCAEYIYYYLNSDQTKQYLLNLNIGGVQPSIKVPHLLAMPIVLPSYKEQRAIANILLSLDNKIALNNRINHNLEEQAHALYKSWFIDFEPFKDGKFVESEFGPIPEGWDILRFDGFSTLSNERVENEFIPEFSVTNTGIFPREAKFNKTLSSSSLKNKAIRKGDLVFGMSRDILNWGVMKEKEGGVSSAYTVYNLDSSLMNEIYLENFMKHHLQYFKDLIKPAAREGQGIDKKLLATKVVYLPTKEVWNSFFNVYSKIGSEREHILSETNKLTLLRDELLPVLMEGHNCNIL